MAFQLKADESIRDGLRRLARKELKSSRSALSLSDSRKDLAIHEARKSIKKVRAIAQLIDFDDGRGLGGCRKRLRRINRKLSDLRDADAMSEILTKLAKGRRRKLDEHTTARLVQRLSAHRQSSVRAAREAGVLKELIRDLREVRRKADDWRPAHRTFKALAGGIERAYRQGRKVFKTAREHPTAENFHESRKRAKALWYFLRLIEGQAMVAGDVKTLHHIEDWLGDDHNIAVLSDFLEKDHRTADLDRLRLVTANVQKNLRQQALSAARRFYRFAPGDYRSRIERAWKKAQLTAATRPRPTATRGPSHRAA